MIVDFVINTSEHIINGCSLFWLSRIFIFSIASLRYCLEIILSGNTDLHQLGEL